MQVYKNDDNFGIPCRMYVCIIDNTVMECISEKSCIEVQDVEVGLHEEAAMLCNVDWNSTQINLISHTYYHVEWRKVYRSCMQPQSLLTLTLRYINGIMIIMSNRSSIIYQGRMIWNNNGIPILRDVTEEDDGLYYCVVGTNVRLSPDNRCFGRNHFFRIKVQSKDTFSKQTLFISHTN